MTRVAADSGLYDPDASSPVLTGSRCGECDSIFFPPLAIGCEVCGHEGIESIPIAAAGTLYSVATVHRHSGKGIEAPFTVAEIALDDGPLIRALLAEPAEREAIGRRVKAVWTVLRTDEAGNEVVEPRFAFAQEEGS